MKSETESRIFPVVELFRKIGLFAIICIAGAVAFSSCNDDDDEEETKPTLGGDLYYNLPAYALAGSVIELDGGGITYPEQDLITYRWTSLDMLADTVYGTHCKVTVPDSIGIFSVILTATSDGYYDRTATKYLTSIKLGPDGSVTDGPVYTQTFTDSRDNQEYGITEIGNLVWFAENLNWAGAGNGYAKTDVMGEITGRLYTWNDATGGVSASGLGRGPQGVCPEGWSIPTKEDWEDLGKALNAGQDVAFNSNWIGLGDDVMINAKFNGEKFWPYTPDCNPENRFGWAALSGGSCTNNYNNYSGLRSYGFWWSATEMASDKACYRYIYYNRPDFNMNYTDKDSFGASVRCVRLKENRNVQ